MSWPVRLLALILLAVTVVLALDALEALPMSRRELVAEKYGGWSGVLRLWYATGWQSGGSVAAWLNRCAAAFERAHPGVYVQAEAVDPEALRALGKSGVAPPDLILFPPGLLASGEGLLPLPSEAVAGAGLREPLAGTGLWGDAPRAVPVAMGAYFWICDAARLEAPPHDWSKAGFALELPPDAPFNSWSGAALALCSGLADADAPGEPSRPDPGLDLGLAGPSLPTATPAPGAGQAGGVPCALPADTTRGADVYSNFVSGSLAAMPATPLELRRLERLAERGRAPDGRAAMPGTFALADQLLLVAAVDAERPHRAERAELALQLIAHLLAPECQAALDLARAFPVAAGIAAYADGGAMARLEAELAEKALLAPNAFDDRWRAEVAAGFARFLAGTCTAREALAGCAGLSTGKTRTFPP